jgi:hypothetical protein
MPSTLLGVVAIAVALIPGALYTWSVERYAGRWGIGLSDRILRFAGGSAVLHAILAPATYWLWANQWPKVRSGQPVSWWLWSVPLTYAIAPIAGGVLVGRAVRAGRRWTRLVVGPSPAPRAWDFLFAEQGLDGWIRMRLKSGTWVAGAFAEANGHRSYAAGYPEPQDLFLAASVFVDPDTGEFEVDDDGQPVLGSGGLLVRWDEIEFLEFIDA